MRRRGFNQVSTILDFAEIGQQSFKSAQLIKQERRKGELKHSQHFQLKEGISGSSFVTAKTCDDAWVKKVIFNRKVKIYKSFMAAL